MTLTVEAPVSADLARLLSNIVIPAPRLESPTHGTPASIMDGSAHELFEMQRQVDQAKAGDRAAFGELYLHYRESVYRFAYRRVGQHALAEDLVAETFLRALRNIGSFSWQGKQFGAWLTTIARNLIADHFKSGRSRLELTIGDVIEVDGVDGDRYGQPERAAIETLTNQALLTAMEDLSDEQRRCLSLRFLDGYTVAETAEAMGKQEGAIKALQYRAVRSLARLLPDGFQP